MSVSTLTGTNKSESSLSSMLTPDTIRLGVQVGDWREAVREVGKLLIASGAVEPRYVEAMIALVEEIGPYIVIAPGIALPHARPEDGVKRACIGLLTLDPPIPFGNESNDPVALVVAFGAPESEKHLEALRDVARLLEDRDRLDRLKSASNADEVLEVIAAGGS